MPVRTADGTISPSISMYVFDEPLLVVEDMAAWPALEA
jgi:hypothetical protein